MNQQVLIAILASALLIAVVQSAAADTDGVQTVNGSNAANACLQGFFLSGTASDAAATCPPCTAGTTTSDGNTASTCTPCPEGKYCTAAASTDDVAQAPTSCSIGYYCPAGASTPTWCPDTAGYAPASTVSVGGCVAPTASIANCANYNASTGAAGTCIRAKKGYYVSGGNPASCFHAECTDCTASTFASCPTVAAGFYRNINASTVAACADGCNACTFSAADSTTACTKAKAGYYLATGVATKCAPGTGAAVDNATASCTACTATNCTACLDPAFCTSCSANFVLTASAGTCAAYNGTKHGTCLGADGSASTNCQSCDPTKNREFPMDTTTSTRKTYGECVCKETFVDQSALSASAPDFTCVSCGLNAKTCTISAAGITITACNTGFFLTSTTVGNKCIAKDATDKPDGIFFDATTSKFVACHITCKTCTAAGADKCVACKEPPSTWVEPTQAATNYARYIQGTRALINATCLDECPVGWVANEARTDCVADQGNSNGLLAIISLILIFFSLV